MPAEYGEALENKDWANEHKPLSHPIVIIANRTELIEYETGRVIARTEQGFEWYWNHQHPHVFKTGSPPLTKKERRALGGQ